MNWIIKIENVAKEDLQYYRKKNKALYIKCFDIIQDILDDPETWIWKPEQLKHFKENMWSRRVDNEHRIVYSIDDGRWSIDFLSFRCHYDH